MSLPLQASLPTLCKFSCTQLCLRDGAELICLSPAISARITLLMSLSQQCLGGIIHGLDWSKTLEEMWVSAVALLLLLDHCFVKHNCFFSPTNGRVDSYPHWLCRAAPPHPKPHSASSHSLQLQGLCCCGDRSSFGVWGPF